MIKIINYFKKSFFLNTEARMEIFFMKTKKKKRVISSAEVGLIGIGVDESLRIKDTFNGLFMLFNCLYVKVKRMWRKN